MNAMTRFYSFALATLWLATAGCSGGSGGDGPAANPPTNGQPATPKPTSRGNLVVTVTDLLGAPVPGAQIDVSSTKWPDEYRSAVADANGRAEVTGVLDDSVHIAARAAEHYGIFQMGGLDLASLGGQASVNARVEIRPVEWGTSGIASAHVVAGGVRDGGRTLEFRLGILGLTYSGGSVRALDCVPDTANDVARFQPDCVAGAEGFDAPYLVLNNGYALSRSQVVACCNDPVTAPSLSATLLLDQSGTVASSDPRDSRLFAAKYFLTQGVVGTRRLSLAAFAANDAASGQRALLPQMPVTIFPAENPVVGAAGRELFPTVDALGSLEGGGAPLYDALDRLIDFAAPGPNEISTIFVLTDGRDTTCGTYSQCKARRQQVLQKSRDRKVTITTIGLAADATGADREALGALSQGSYSGDRAAFWAGPSSLFEIVQAAMRIQQRTGDRYEATFQVQAPTAGTFVSGRTVVGTVRWTPCPVDCGDIDIPFAVEIP